MRMRILLAGAALAGGLAIAAVHAQTPVPQDQSGPFASPAQWNGGYGRMTEEERARQIDRRLSDMKSRLQLTADQEKLWPAVETAMRDMQKTTADLRDQMRNAMQAERNSTGQMPEPAARLRNMAAMSTARANGLMKLADAIDPLYKSFDDNQKRRFADMSRYGGLGGGDGRRGYEGRDTDRGYGRRWRDDERGDYGRRWRERDDERGYSRRWRDDERGEWRGRDEERGYGRRWRDDERGDYGRRWRDEDRGDRRRNDWE